MIKLSQNIMTVDTNTMISITEVNQNFSKVARVVDEHGTAVILKNNVPRYFVIEFRKAEQEKITSTEECTCYIRVSYQAEYGDL